jgi:Animal haem peroxidase
LTNPKCYDPNLNPQVTVEFNEAFRVMHYFIRDKFKVYKKEVFNEVEGLKLAQPELIDQNILIDNLTFYTDNFCGVSSGLCQSSWNSHGLGPLTHCKFFANSSSLGADLRAWDFQFGREVGEPTACEFVKIVHKNDKCIENMDASILLHVEDNIKTLLLKKYGKVQNIPLSALLDFQFREPFGVSTHEIIADQMKRLTCGDRFWYNHENGLFTLGKIILVQCILNVL